jgi:hypothetical protein
MKIQGKFYAVSEAFQVNETFKKREFVLEYSENGKYPQYIQFELHQDKCGLVEGFKQGDLLTVEFDLRGREWVNPKGEKKYFNTLVAWRIVGGDAATQSNENKQTEPAFEVNPDAFGDDLPF